MLGFVAVMGYCDPQTMEILTQKSYLLMKSIAIFKWAWQHSGQ